MQQDSPRVDRTAAVAALRDPARRALFDAVTRSAAALSTDELVAETAIPKSTAASHLSRLVDAGVLVVTFERRSGRSGPGAGRPAKVYRAADGEIAASIPTRDYELMGEVLAGALEATAAGGSVHDALRGASTARGDAVSRRHGELASALTAVGYEPATGDDGVISLTNCPFHRLAATHGELVCQANLGLVAAIAAGTTPSDGTARDAVLAPAPGRCCVQLVPAAART